MSLTKLESIEIVYDDKEDGEIIDPSEWNNNFYLIETKTNSNVQKINNMFDLLESTDGNISLTYKGLKSNMPTLIDGEIGFTTDTNELFIGNDGVNTAIGSQESFDHSKSVGNPHNLPIDATLSNDSVNPIQNKVVKEALDEIIEDNRVALEKKVNKEIGKTLTTNDFTDADKAALDELNINAKDIVSIYSDAIMLTSDFVDDTTYEEYPFIATINMPNATDKLYAYVNFGLTESISGNYAPVVKTGSGKIYIYAKEIPESDIIIPTVLLYNAKEQEAPLPSTYLTFNVAITKTASVELGGIKATLTKKGSSETKEEILATDGTCKFAVDWGDGEYTVKLTNIPKGYAIAPIIQSGVKGGEYNVMSSIEVKLFKIMTVKIDESDSNPETCVTYHADAVDMTPKSPEWDEFFGHKPCLFKDGKVVDYLNPNDFTKFADGSPADITSGNAGDVMIEFPRRNWVITKVGSIVTMSITDDLDKFDEGFDCIAHKRGQVMKDAMYIGAYKGSELNGKLRSLSGKTPASNKTIGQFRNLAQANGVGYEQAMFYPLTYRQMMYIMKYKNLNSQTAVGRGFVDGNTAATTTGSTNTKGMDWGEGTGKQSMKLFGLEDFWGNLFEWIDGIITNSTRNILTATTSFNDTGSGYTDQGQGATANIGNYMNKPQGTTETGFLAKEVTGSDSTYFCDSAYLSASCVAYFGGYWYYASDAGAFSLLVSYDASAASASRGARLMFLQAN